MSAVPQTRDYLTPIIARKKREVARRHAHARLIRTTLPDSAATERGKQAEAALRRQPGELPHVIAEFKRASPSAGVIRAGERGDVAQITGAYARGGASALSVLCDGPGFSGSPLDARRAATTSSLPVLFKEFVLDEIQLELAQRVGAHMVLLVVRVLSAERLAALVDATLQRGLAPVVEAADLHELELAQRTRATIIGINARDLRSFRVDVDAARTALATIEPSRIAVHMSGIRTREDFQRIAETRADAVLIGEGLMRASEPAAQLRELLSR